MRIVRHGKSSEYGHQDYYENLGYINVYTNDSDLENEESKEKAKLKFYSEASEHLENGTNIIVSPEGTSFITEESPGPFKMGPFNLAAQVEREPYIVPVVFCNFDKRISEKLFYCKVLTPFKVSEKIGKHQSLKEFVIAYRDVFALEVENARLHADQLLHEHNDNHESRISH